MPSQQILQKKMSEVEEVKQLINKYKVVGIASLHKVRASQLQVFKRNLSEKAYMRVIKNTLFRLAIENCKEKPQLEKLAEHITGPTVYLFTDSNPFKLASVLKKGKIKTTAKSGDIAAFDVTVPAGNTGQPPGPIISQLNAVGLPTRIEAGSVWVSKDTSVVKKGEVINERLASVLSKLGIKPVEAGLIIKAAFDEGLVITQEQLDIDVERTRQNMKEVIANAFALTLSIAYPTPQNMKILLQVSHREAYLLSVNAAIPTKETIVDLIKTAHAEMLSLSSRLPSLEEKAVSSEKAEKS